MLPIAIPTERRPRELTEKQAKQDQLDQYREICSEIIPDKLYLSGMHVATNLDILQQHGITHIINTAGDIVDSPFVDDIEYLTFHLKDTKEENITSCFYESLSFINQATINDGGRVLVHCVEGVSRSATLVICYLMMTERAKYSDAFARVKKIRAIADPNVGFTTQLLYFQERLATASKVTLTFSLSPANPQLPGHPLPRLVLGQQLSTMQTEKCYVVNGSEAIYIWEGDASDDKSRDSARQFAVLLHQYEYAPQQVITVEEGEAPKGLVEALAHIPPRVADLKKALLEKLAQREGKPNIQIKKAFHMVDLNNDKRVDFGEFQKMIEGFMSGFSEKDLRQMFVHCGGDDITDSIDLPTFLAAVNLK